MALTKVSRGLLSTGIVDNSNATAITIDSSENVGIGTSSTYNMRATIAGAGAAVSTGTGSYALLSLYDTSTAGIGKGGGIAFQGEDGTNSAVTFAAINGSKENAGTGNYASYLGFSTRANGGNLTEKMRIDSSGEVILNAGFQVGELRIHANQIASGYTTDEEDRDVWINYTGYNGGATRFRDFRVGNGKQVQIVFVDGSAGSVAITGSLSVSSSFSKGSGSFKIDHPLPAKTETHHLVHSFIEGPQADNIYRGKIDLVDGSATVNIDTAAGMTEGTYVLLNTNTQCFTSNESGWTAVKGSVSGNTLTITAQESCSDTISWMVIGERQDQHMIETEWTDDNGKVIVEPLKELE
jgi:hypothetical protein